MPPPPPLELHVFNLSLVDWRWARERGFYDAAACKWVESKGGVGGYINDLMARRLRKAKRAKGSRNRRLFEVEKCPLVGVGGGVHFGARADAAEREGVRFEMNLDGLDPIDLFGGFEEFYKY
jgi:hypothetical protein